MLHNRTQLQAFCSRSSSSCILLARTHSTSWHKTISLSKPHERGQGFHVAFFAQTLAAECLEASIDSAAILPQAFGIHHCCLAGLTVAWSNAWSNPRQRS
ncbi:hypothetical protein BD414DRAFT_276671 [Trametes punicea]|nr:hypothetical protein BD414DRAFT_276671 [Trametes punicea]